MKDRVLNEKKKIEREFLKYVSQNILAMLGISAYVLADTFLFPGEKGQTASRH